MIRLEPHQAIILQGPMKFEPTEITAFYSQFNNIVWSTWDDEDPNMIQFAKKHGIHVLLNKKPSFNGYLNINLQFHSTLKGIEYFKEVNKNITEVIKIRSDIIVHGVERLLNVMSGKDIGFMYMYDVCFEFHKPMYYLDYWHYGMDFPCDVVIFGNIDVMYNVFNFQMEYFSEIPPESIILRNYLKYKNYELNFNLEYLKNIGIDFFTSYMNEHNIHFISKKNNISELLRYERYNAFNQKFLKTN